MLEDKQGAGSSPPFTKEDKTEDTRRKITGCLPPLLLLHLLRAQARQRGSASLCLKVCVRIAGGSSGPCSCAGGPSWSG